MLDVQDCAKLWPIIIWPEGSELIAILYIERPINLTARSLTWSYYANNNTVKYLIGIIPRDTICSVLKGWSRRTCYQHVTENPSFSKYLVYADTVMADWWLNTASRGCWYVHSWNVISPFIKRGWDLLKILSPRSIANFLLEKGGGASLKRGVGVEMGGWQFFLLLQQ